MKIYIQIMRNLYTVFVVAMNITVRIVRCTLRIVDVVSNMDLADGLVKDGYRA